ncbi:MAG: hypothetical protein C7B47_06360 [Sulfobacillus thermosulfidooxidans]|uniref:HTH cro/C1-type domain-containing protein n=1 Tax=Sulfobacillus thermosulfidooxidans TaxID=28034 RepID=A0A2T2X0R6_SULTH|nr:MAG: hypothetical protein C7B47_06360 [Sulfobacillus thermosulfidooxidans]
MDEKLCVPKRKWTKENIVNAIKDRAMHNRPMNSFAVRQEDEGLWQAAKRHFGGWKEALSEAGISVDSQVSPRSRARAGTWSREVIITRIQQYRDQGSHLAAHQMQKIDNRLVSAAGYYFGSWAKALEAAGVNADAVRFSVPWSAERVKTLIIDAKKSGADLSDRSIRFWNRALYRAACEHFGSWEDAVQSALQTSNTEMKWNSERVKRLIYDYFIHGFSLNEAFRYHPRLSHAVIHHYGSLENLAKELNLPQAFIRRTETSQAQAKQLKAWRLERGLSQEDVAKALHLPPLMVETYENAKIAIPWDVYWKWATLMGKRRQAFRELFASHKNHTAHVYAHASIKWGGRRQFSSNSLCFVVDPAGRIRHWGKNLTRITGIHPKDSEGHPCSDIVHTYLNPAQPYCGKTCPVKPGPLDDDPPIVHWQHPLGPKVRMHMMTDTLGWTTHWIEPVPDELTRI